MIDLLQKINILVFFSSTFRKIFFFLHLKRSLYFFCYKVCKIKGMIYLFGGPGGSMSEVTGSNNSYKHITNAVWVHDRLCKLQKRVHSTRSRKW